VSAAEQLEWEQRWRTPVAIAAIVGGVLPLLGVVVRLLLAPDQPLSKAGQLLYIDEHGPALLLSVVILGIGALGVGATMYYLWVATKARKPDFPPVAKWGVVGGAVLVCLGQIVLYVLLIIKASSFVSDGVFSYDAAKQAQRSSPVVVVSTAQLVGQLGMGFGIVMICLNAMRVGLLTRFMGALGMIVGVLLVIPLGGPLPVVQTFWLVALAFLLLGRWPSPVPAWETGRAEPWPGRQQVVEQQAREGGSAGGGRAPGGSDAPPGGLLGGLFGGRAKAGSTSPDAAPAAAVGEGTASPSTSAAKKRKRKKRR
jgi:hypothetical protein